MIDSKNEQPRLILASSSPYRRELLERFGLPFECISPDVDESHLDNESAEALAARLAGLKAAAVAEQHPDAIVIGSDQVLECNGEFLGKPGNKANAIAQLQKMSGQTLQFYTAMQVRKGQQQAAELAVTKVQFRELNPGLIESYLEREPAFDVAGSCKAESLGIAMCDSIESDDPTALIGLPLIRLRVLLGQFDLNVI